MAYRDLRAYLDDLDASGELKRVGAEVDWNLEMTEILERLMKSGGPAVVFENVKDYDIPVASNLFGSWDRMKRALGADPEELACEIEALFKQDMPETIWEKMKALPRLAQFASFIPKTVRSGPCKEVIMKGDDVDLFKLPIPKCWPDDGGRYICIGHIVTQNPNEGTRNVGIYRLQIFDSRTTGFHSQIHKTGAKHFRLWEKQGKDMPVAVAFGGDPAITYSATAPLPEEFDEILFAGFIRKDPVEMVKCETVDLEVPANSEIVIEGYVKAGERRIEGPYGDHTGVYSLQAEYPVFHVTAITTRHDPIYPHTIVGKPIMEDYYIGKASERIFLPLLKMMLPELVDVNFPPESIFHNWAVVSIRKQYPGHARKVMHALWGLGQFMFTKVIMVMDEDVDVHNMNDVLWRVWNNIDPGRDVAIVEGPVDSLNHVSPLPDYGTKMGIDATVKWKSEGFDRPWPDELVMSPEVRKKVDTMWQSLGF